VRVAVTGSTGLIGSALVASLRGDGHEVVRVVRGAIAGEGPTVQWDLGARTIDAAGLDGVDAVVHLAGESIAGKRWTDEQRRKVLESRTIGTDVLVRALTGLDQPPRVLLSGSAIGYYGDRGDEELTEASDSGSLFLSEVCRAWEAAAQPAVDGGIRTAFLRTGIVLDPAGGMLGKVLPLFRFALGGRLGDGRQWMSWITLADHVRALRFLLEHDVAGPVNLTAPAPVTNAEFTKALGTVLARPTVVPVPRFGARLLLGRAVADELLFASQRVAPAVLVSSDFEFGHPELAGALRSVLGR
jgi:uncharacterized protein (TIGR01777 family)